MSDNIDQLVVSASKKNGLLNNTDTKTQMLKLAEEFGELAEAIMTDSPADIMDAIGDMAVVLCNLAHLNKLSFTGCYEHSARIYHNRVGKIVNKTFVKEK